MKNEFMFGREMDYDEVISLRAIEAATTKALQIPVNVLQDELELSQLLALVKNLKPRHVLEIGSMFGGTLWLWMQQMPNGGHIVSIDKLMPKEDERYMPQELGHRITWNKWAAERNLKFDVLETSSQEERTFNQVKGIMPSVDFLFIDGDHSADAVRRDYELYSPLVKKGIIAFHDIAGERGVFDLWEEVKTTGHAHFEYVHMPGRYGIGALCDPQ